MFTNLIKLNVVAGRLTSHELANDASTRWQRVVRYQCTRCYDMHDSEAEAAGCCERAEDNLAATTALRACPACLTQVGIDSFEDAVDCCLIKFGVSFHQRDAITRALSTGATWHEALMAHAPQLVT